MPTDNKMSQHSTFTSSPMDYQQWARVYDLFYSVGPELEVDFYLDLMRACHAPVLELGVGTGRVAIPAALAGHRVVGVDLHPTMLEVARSKAAEAEITPGTLELVQGDMTELSLQFRDFGMVIIPGNTLALVLTEPGQQATLTRAAKHLRRGGTLALSLYNASDQVIDSDDNQRFLLGVVDDSQGRERHILSGTNHFDRSQQTNDCTQYIETVSPDGTLLQQQTLRVVTRYLTFAQAASMVSRAGLRVDHVFGDFNRSGYSEDSDEMIFVCTKVV